MRKIRIVGFGLFVVLALCALNAAPAFAESEWLVEKMKVEITLNVETEGDLTLVQFASADSEEVLTEKLCSYLFDGTIKGKEGMISDALSLEHGITVGSLGDVNEGSLKCEVIFSAGGMTDCKVGTLVLLWFKGLNLELEARWPTEISLVGGSFFNRMPGLNNLDGSTGLDLECESLGGFLSSELCEWEVASTELENVSSAPQSVLEYSALVEYPTGLPAVWC